MELHMVGLEAWTAYTLMIIGGWACGVAVGKVIGAVLVRVVFRRKVRRHLQQLLELERQRQGVNVSRET